MQKALATLSLAMLLCPSGWASAPKIAPTITPAPVAGQELFGTARKQYGLYLSSVGETSIDAVSLNGAWNFAPDWRLTVGVSYGLGTGVGVGVKYLLLSETYPVRPFIGLSVSAMESRFFDLLAPLLSGTSPRFYTYVLAMLPLGVDWLHSSGFNLAAGGMLVRHAWTSDPSSTFDPVFMLFPFISVGWYFD